MLLPDLLEAIQIRTSSALRAELRMIDLEFSEVIPHPKENGHKKEYEKKTARDILIALNRMIGNGLLQIRDEITEYLRQYVEANPEFSVESLRALLKK